MPPDINQIEEKRRADFNHLMLQSDRERNKDDNEIAIQKRTRISNATTFFMLFVAGLIDGVQILLEWLLIGFFINWFVDICVWVLFFLWFKSKGVNLINFKSDGLIFNGLAFLEIIPAVDELPLWILDIGIITAMVKIEDKMAGNY
jgi:hypothetical protein